MRNNKQKTDEQFDALSNYIAACYKHKCFPEKSFQFFENRRDYKDQFRTGVYTPSQYSGTKERLFFKILDHDFSKQESTISQTIHKDFNIIEAIYIKENKGAFFHFYPYIDAHDIDGYSYLRKADIGLDEKKNKLKEHMTKLKSQISDTMCVGVANDKNNESNKLFFPRLEPTGRCVEYYGQNYTKLHEDVKLVSPQFSENIKKLTSLVKEKKDSSHKTVLGYTHGDFHDFNFSYDGTFWDLDTFGKNPLTNDFAIFYWHFYSREDSLIPKYNPWLSKYMKNELNQENLEAVRGVKKSMVSDYYSFIESAFDKQGKLDHFRDEMTVKLFCRAFLVDNVLKFSQDDRHNLYRYWNNYMSKDKSKDFFQEALFPYNSHCIDNFPDISNAHDTFLQLNTRRNTSNIK